VKTGMRQLSAVICPLALACASGCPGVAKPLEKPTVSVTSVSVTSVSLTGLDARISFSITNPNAFGLPLKAVDWELSISGAAPVRGRATLSETIPAKGAAPVDVDVRVSATAAVETATKIASGGNQYRVRGTLHFESRFGDIAVAFDETGSMSELPL
jgi:LEA14-like dessication related protein